MYCAELMCMAAICMAPMTAAAVAGAPSDPASVSLKPLDRDEFDASAAAHLLRRAAFGGTADEVDRLVALGLDAAVAQLVDYDEVEFAMAPPEIDALVAAPRDRALMQAMTPDERQQFMQRVRQAERRSFEEVRLWWLERMLRSPRPLEERMTLFWHGHFTSGMREVRNPVFMHEQNQLLRKYALGSFRELLIGISKDRAMLVYLDGNKNERKQPNENYARELLELFTLGVGHYSEDDIKAAARAFTGWTFDEQGFVFRGRLHDYGEKTFLGRTGKLDGDDVIDRILEQPACARFLSRALLEYFVRPEPDKRLVEALAREIVKHKFELRPVFRTLLKSQAFYHGDSRGSLIRSPVELLVGTARDLGIEIASLLEAERAIASMGQELMQPPNVKGWDGASDWINTATLFQRYNTVNALINGAGSAPIPDRLMRRREERTDEEAASDDDLDARGLGERPMAPVSRMSGRKQPAYDALGVIRERELTSAEQIVDYYAGRLLAGPLPNVKRQQLVHYLQGEDGTFDLDEKRAEQRIRTMICLMCSTPEFQMF